MAYLVSNLMTERELVMVAGRSNVGVQETVLVGKEGLVELAEEGYRWEHLKRKQLLILDQGIGDCFRKLSTNWMMLCPAGTL